jgi:hypothetical protein
MQEEKDLLKHYHTLKDGIKQLQNIDAVTALKEIYVVTKNMDKVKEMKAKEAELSSCTSKIIILYLTIKAGTFCSGFCLQ